MWILWVVLGVVVWVGCGALAWGYHLGYFDYEHPAMNHSGDRPVAILYGPVALAVDLSMFGTKHWRWTPRSKEERWEIFHATYPNLSRAYFEERYR